MTNGLQVWSPMVRELNRFPWSVDELFERWFGSRIDDGKGDGVLNPTLESFVADGKMVVRIHLRGVEPKDVEIMAADKILTIRGKREQRSVDKDSDGFRREIHYASFEHSIELPEGVKPEEITASYRNGVLELTAPMPESAVGRKIAIELDSPSSTQNA